MTFNGVTYRNSLPSPLQVIHYFADHLNAVDKKTVTVLVDSIRIAKKDLKQRLQVRL